MLIQRTQNIEKYAEEHLSFVEDPASRHFIASPLFMEDQSPLETFLIFAAIVKLSKTPEGLRVLRDLGIHYLDNVGRIISTLEASSASNWLTAAINQRLCSHVMRRLGLIEHNAATEYTAWLSWVTGTMIAKGFITETIGALSSMGNIGQWAKALT